MNLPVTPPAVELRARALVGLIGEGIQRSLTPALHEEEAAHHGLRLHYQLIDLERDRDRRGAAALPMLIDSAHTMGFAGLNITYPCKQAVIPLLDALSDEARAMGAVNTVVCREGRLTGHNTDGSGWRWGFERALPGADMTRVVLLGAGGAGSAIAHALSQLKTETLVLVDSDAARAAALAAQQASRSGTRVIVESDLAAAMRGASGLVHATPTGMDKLPGLPLPHSLLRPQLWVSEVVYFPLETALLKAARTLGCAVVDGGTMAVGQAVGALRLITGIEPDTDRMDRHFRRLVAARGPD